MAVCAMPDAAARGLQHPASEDSSRPHHDPLRGAQNGHVFARIFLVHHEIGTCPLIKAWPAEP